MSIEVSDAPERNRYEAIRDGTVLGFAEYQRTAELVVFTHTEIDPAFEGQGVGSALVRSALDDVRERGLKALPVCPFVQAWIQRHPGLRRPGLPLRFGRLNRLSHPGRRDAARRSASRPIRG